MASDMKPEERAERVATEWHHSGARIAREHVSVAEIAKEIRDAEQQARKEAFEEAAKLVEEEPELPGSMPPILEWNARIAPERFARITVQITKKNVAEKIRSRAKEDQSRG